MLDTTNLLWYSTLAVQTFFCFYLIKTLLAKTYPIFTASLGFGVLRSIAAMYFMRGAVGARLPLSYTYFWLWTEPFWLLLQIAVALEVHTRMWREHRDIVRQTRPLLIFALLTAIVAAAIPIQSEAAHAGASRLILIMHFGIQVTRYICSVLAIFLALSAILYFIAVRNGLTSVFRHEGMLAAYFGIYALSAFLIDEGWVRTSLVNGYFVSAITLCFVAWFGIFKPQQSTAIER